MTGKGFRYYVGIDGDAGIHAGRGDQGNQDREQQAVDVIGHGHGHEAVFRRYSEALSHEKGFPVEIAHGLGPDLGFARCAACEQAQHDLVDRGRAQARLRETGRCDVNRLQGRGQVVRSVGDNPAGTGGGVDFLQGIDAQGIGQHKLRRALRGGRQKGGGGKGFASV